MHDRYGCVDLRGEDQERLTHEIIRKNKSDKRSTLIVIVTL